MKENMLYKYKSISTNEDPNEDQLLDSIKNHYLWLANPGEFNDPFEFFVQNDYTATDEEKIYWCKFNRLLQFFQNSKNDRPKNPSLNLICENLKKSPQELCMILCLYNEDSKKLADKIFESNLFVAPKIDEQAVLQKINADLSKRKTDVLNGNFEKQRQEECKRLGVLSLTPNYKDMLMWSHYGDSHKGVCLGYSAKCGEEYGWQNYEIDIENKKDYVLDGVQLGVGAYKVSYTRKPDAFRLFNISSEAFMQALYSKTPCWKYEDEYRIVMPNAQGLPENQFRKMIYKKEILKEVIFGCKTPKEHIDLIMSAVKENYSHEVKFYQSRLDADTLDLAEPEIMGDV